MGSGLELIALTAVVLGGVSLAGGRGSVVRATLGVAIVAMISQATLLNNLDSSWYVVILAVALIAFTTLDLRFGKYRGTLAQKLAMNPGKLNLGPLVDVTAPGTPWTINRRLTEAKAIGLGRVEGGEDVVIDRNNNIYCGDRRGWIWRFEGPDDEGHVFARTGGMPLGLAWDAEDNLLCAVGGIGLVRIAPDGSQETLGAQTRKTWHKIADDSLVRAADDLDVAPDGSVYFSDFSSRYQASRKRNRGSEELFLPQRRVHRPRRRVDPDRGHLVVPGRSVVDLRSEGGTDRDGHGKPSRLSRQHQPCI